MPKVMLVEDDENLLSLLHMFLQIEGFEVVEINSNKEIRDIENTLGLIRREHPDLLVMDVYLKEIDGFDLLRKLKGDANLHSVRVLMSSGIDFTYQCRQEGADGFLLKPYMPDELLDRIRKTLG